MNNEDYHIRVKKIAIGVALTLAALGVFLFIVSLDYLADQVALHERGRVHLAQITEAERTDRGTEAHFKVQYEVQIDGRNYQRIDITGEPDAWIEVSKATWEEASSTGQLPVYVLPEDPTVNWPEQAKENPMTIGYVTAGLGALLIAIVLALIGRTAIEYKRVRESGAPALEDYIMVVAEER